MGGPPSSDSTPGHTPGDTQAQSPSDSSASAGSPHSFPAGHTPDPTFGAGQSSWENHSAYSQQYPGVFSSIRRGGWLRGAEGIIGGVCSGIALRGGWDPILVRGITLILTILFPPIILVYTILWALLPDYSDGRIHLEDLAQGRFSSGQLGILIFLILGLGSFSHPLLGVMFFGTIGPFFSIVAGLGIVVLLGIILIPYFLRPRSPHPPYSPSPQEWPTSSPYPSTSFGASMSTPPSPDPSSPSSQPGAYPAGAYSHAGAQAPTGGYPSASGSYSTPPYSMGASPYIPWSTPQTLTRPRKVSRRFNLIITGIIVIVIAAAFAFMRYGGQKASEIAASQVDIPNWGAEFVFRSMLIGGGLALVIAGAAIAWASIQDRSAGWLASLSIFGLFLAFPTAAVGGAGLSYDGSRVYVDSQGIRVDGETLTSRNLSADWTADSVSEARFVDKVILDLTTAPADLQKTITVSPVALDNLELHTRTNQNVTLIFDNGIDDIEFYSVAHRSEVGPWLPQGPQVNGEDTYRTYQSPARVNAGKDGIVIRVTSWLDSAEVTESNIQPPADQPASANQAPSGDQPASAQRAPSSDQPASGAGPRTAVGTQSSPNTAQSASN